MKTSFRKKLFTTSMLVAPAILILGSAQPARADCTVVVGGGTVASPANGSIINCKTFGGDQTTTIGDGSDGVHANVNLFDNAVVNVGTDNPAINIQNVTVTLGSNANLETSYVTGGPPSKYNSPVRAYTSGASNASAVVTLSGENSSVSGNNKYGIQAKTVGGSGNASVHVTLSGNNSSVYAGYAVSARSKYGSTGNASATVTLSGEGARIEGPIGVDARSKYGSTGNASVVATLSGANSRMNTYRAISASSDANASTHVTLSGANADIFSGGNAINTVGNGNAGYTATSVVTLSGSGAKISTKYGTGKGVYVKGGDASAIVTLGANTSIISTGNTIEVNANQAGASGSTIDSRGLIQATGGGSKSIFLDDGNDILNLRTDSDLSSAGGADMGGGNDTVNLFGTDSEDEVFLNAETLNMNGSAWTLSGNSVFTNINVNDGMLTADGSLTGTVTVANGARLAGSGTIIGAIASSGVVSPGDGGIGTLNQTGNFTQNANGRLNIQFGPATIDLLNITGVANLDGTVAFSQSITGVTNGTTLTFLQTTGGTTGTFSNIVHPIFIDTALTYGQGAVDVTFTRLSLTTAAQTDSEFAIAQQLDALIAGGGPNGTAIDTIVNSFTTTEQASDFFASQSGVVQDGLNFSGLDNMELGADAAMGRLGDSGGGDFAMLDNAGGYVTGMNAGDPFVGHSRAMWGKVMGGWGSLDGDSNARGFDYSAGGAAVGGEVYLDRNVTAGIFGAFSSSHASPDGLSDEARTKTYQIGLYAGKHDGPWTYGGTISGAWMDFDTERPTALGDAGADFNGSGWFSEVNVAYGVPHNGWTIGPVGGLEYASVHHDSYTESGAGILDLSVDSDTTDNLKSLVGVQAYRSFMMDKGRYSGSFVVDPSFTLEWAHEFLDRSSDTNVAFASVPTVSFETNGPEKSRDAARIRAELVGHPVDRDKLRLYVAYDGNLASDYQDHRGTIGVKIKW